METCRIPENYAAEAETVPAVKYNSVQGWMKATADESPVYCGFLLVKRTLPILKLFYKEHPTVFLQ